jgi:hypothetical protein
LRNSANWLRPNLRLIRSLKRRCRQEKTLRQIRLMLRGKKGGRFRTNGGNTCPRANRRGLHKEAQVPPGPPRMRREGTSFSSRGLLVLRYVRFSLSRRRDYRQRR